jgi:hypothetical protein
MTDDHFHHHHLPDGSIVRHSHPEESTHGLRVVQTNPEGFAMASTVTERYAAECSAIRWPRPCSFRRYDS